MSFCIEENSLFEKILSFKLAKQILDSGDNYTSSHLKYTCQMTVDYIVNYRKVS